MATLYELTGATAQLYALMQDGEIDEATLQDTLEAMGVDDKIDGCCKVIKQLEAESEMLKAESDRLSARAASLKNNAKYIRNNLVNYMQVTDQKSIKTLLFTLSKRATKKVVIADGVDLPEQYIKIKKEIDKTALKNDLLNGVIVDGASIEINDSLTIK